MTELEFKTLRYAIIGALRAGDLPFACALFHSVDDIHWEEELIDEFPGFATLDQNGKPITGTKQ